MDYDYTLWLSSIIILIENISMGIPSIILGLKSDHCEGTFLSVNYNTWLFYSGIFDVGSALILFTLCMITRNNEELTKYGIFYLANYLIFSSFSYAIGTVLFFDTHCLYMFALPLFIIKTVSFAVKGWALIPREE